MPNQVFTESNNSIHLYRVLEDEYINLYGPLPDEYPWLFLQSHIKDRPCLIAAIKKEKTPLNTYLKQKLDCYFEKQIKKTKAKLADPDLKDSGSRASLQDQLTLLNNLKELPPYPPIDPRGRELTDALVDVFNEILIDKTFYKTHRPFLGVNIQEDTKRLIAEHLKDEANEPSLTVICRINRFLLEDAFPDEIEKRDLENLEAAHRSYVAAIYSAIHKRERSALCLSGGGIRSATFNLGVIQGLARHGLLDKFDYLSTVSGGGYIGSWLSSWIHREPGGIDAVIQRLSQKPTSVLEPEPEPLGHLREYSNYLSPRLGLLSADTWTLFAIVARNLLLNWLVFLPLLTAVIMTPRLYVSAMTQNSLESWIPSMVVIAIAGKLVAICYLAVTLPSSGRRNNSQKEFLWFGLTPLLVSACLFTLAFGWYQWNGFPRESDRGQFQQTNFLDGSNLILGSIVIGLIGLSVYTIARLRRRHNSTQCPWWKFALMTICVGGVVIVISALNGFVAWKLSSWRMVNPVPHAHAYASFAVPSLLLLYCVGGTLVAGFTSKWFEEDDLEWWARCSAWILIVAFGWSVIAVLVFYGPLLPAKIAWATTWLEWKFIGPAIATILGIISGTVTLIGGFSSGTPAHRKQETTGESAEPTSEKPSVLHRITPFAAPAFLVSIIVGLSLGTNALILFVASRIQALGPIAISMSQTLIYWLFEMRIITALRSLFDGVTGRFQVRGTPSWMDHSEIICYTPFRLALAVWLALIILGWIMARVINTNIFSIHSLYGNRLKRAYLGASRLCRRPHRFTGFDSTDDVQMHELRTELFDQNSFCDLHGLVYKIKQPPPDDLFSSDLRRRLSPNTLQLLDQLIDPQDPSPELKNALIEDLNRLLHGDSLYDKQRFPDKNLRNETRTLLARPPLDESRVLLNRWLLEDAYRNEIDPRKPPRLLHVVNIALNLVRGERLAWQERRAETFTVSPLHSGNLWLGYRRSRYYGGDNGISLGTAFTVSGAAASPNMGYMVSSPLVSFLMAMFNVRLGWWLGNPGRAGNMTYQLGVPRFTFGPIVQEALSLTDDTSKYVYLSDGGHFENLGLYEMVLRRCKVIVVSDATTDSNYNYDSLGMAIRKVRIDLGIPIEMEDFSIAPDRPDNPYFTIGRIRYSCVDDDGADGTLIYIKASLSKREPRDIINYWRANRDFPQEPISDQFFIESQFESYRMLGSYIVSCMCTDPDEDLEWQANGLSEFVDRLTQPRTNDEVEIDPSTNGHSTPKERPEPALTT
ncbi:MAG TPA: patatin-like phospholipase family protein [Pyrinomonadaceae bacterium]|nr:patatin-like phospholipase family protein [Pyrinomonadaceae bacterium]